MWGKCPEFMAKACDELQRLHDIKKQLKKKECFTKLFKQFVIFKICQFCGIYPELMTKECDESTCPDEIKND